MYPPFGAFTQITNPVHPGKGKAPCDSHWNSIVEVVDCGVVVRARVVSSVVASTKMIYNISFKFSHNGRKYLHSFTKRSLENAEVRKPTQSPILTLKSKTIMIFYLWVACL